MDNLISIRKLAELAGTTSRTLRHYEQIDLLIPTNKSSTGERFYSPQDMLKLQQILILRELEMPLEQIAELILNQVDQVESLATHLTGLREKQRQLSDQIATVELTIERLKRKEALVPEELYEGFNNDPYADEAQQRWPDQYAESQRRLKRLSKDEQKALFEAGNQNHLDLAELFKAGESAGSEAVQQVIAKHYEWVAAFWTPNREAYINLGEMYVSDPRFTAHYDKFAPGLAVFMRDAMRIWANANLA